jgi:hypothetical protein
MLVILFHHSGFPSSSHSPSSLSSRQPQFNGGKFFLSLFPLWGLAVMGCRLFGFKAYPSLWWIWGWKQKRADLVIKFADTLIMREQDVFYLKQASFELRAADKRFTHFNERSHHENAHLNGLRAVENVGMNSFGGRC